MEKTKRITIISGHYGSGKTNIAVNLAIDLKKQFDKVAVADLDIVNPYFRTKDSISDFESNGIRLISSEYAGSNVDIPALPQEMYAITDDKDCKMIVDLGGDDRGALALGRLTPEIIKENDYEMLFVVNKFRPLTPDVESTVAIAREIEFAGKIKFTGVINNSNLGVFTTEDDVLVSIAYADQIAETMQIPVSFTSVKSDIYEGLKNKIKNLYSLKLQAKI